MKIKKFRGLEILDSRGRPTVKAFCQLDDGTRGAASVPSGASTGKAEAIELRDNDQHRHQGLGVKKAISKIESSINGAIRGIDFGSQEDLDIFLLNMDGTANKSELGSNAILACSLAYARACASHLKIPLYEYFGSLIENHDFALPQLTINLFSGGKHAGGQIAVQDVLIVPSASSIEESLHIATATYQSASQLIMKKYGARPLSADEGGLAPEFTSVDQILNDAAQAINRGGLTAGKNVYLAMDIAASHFYLGGNYNVEGKLLDSIKMIELIESWVKTYPIVSIEDGLFEEDWSNWAVLKKRIGNHTKIIGDDLLCTQTKRIKKAIEMDAADALLLKVNQCGTLTEAADALQLARGASWDIVVSARSGETEDDWLADLAVGWGADQIKVGSVTQSERLAKYNRLLEMEKFDKLAMRDTQ